MQKHQRHGYTLTLKVKYADYQQMTRAQSVDYLLKEQEVIYDLSVTLLQEYLDRSRKVRLLGLTVSNLIEPTNGFQHQQLSLKLPPFFE